MEEFTLREIYTAYGISRRAIQGYEKANLVYSKVELGFNNPSVDMLIALTDIFHCDYNAFFQH